MLRMLIVYHKGVCLTIPDSVQFRNVTGITPQYKMNVFFIFK
jgi:hypothetical protein